MSDAEGTIPVSIPLHALSEADAARAAVLLTKSSLRGIKAEDKIGHFVMLEQRDGTQVGLDLNNIGRIAIVRRGRGCQAAMLGMMESGDARGAWSQFALIEGTEEPKPSAMDGGGFVYYPFFTEPDDGRKLRARLHVVLEDAPGRPMDGNRPVLEAPRAFVHPSGQTEALKLLTDDACAVLQELAGVGGSLCKHRLLALGATSPQNSYWDRGKMPNGAGIKRFGFRFTANEVVLDEKVGLYRLKDEVITNNDDDQVDRGTWQSWRFHPYTQAMRSRSDMTLTGLGLLFNALDELDA